MKVKNVLSLIVLLSASLASATPAYVQSASGSSSSASSVTTGSITTTAGCLLAISVSTRDGAAPTSVTDSQSDTVTTGPNAGTGNSGIYLYTFYVMNCHGGATTVTANFSGSHQINVGVNQYSGVSTTVALETYAAKPEGAACPRNSQVVTSGTSDVIFTAANERSSSSPTWTGPSGFTKELTVTNPGQMSTALFDDVGSGAVYPSSVSTSTCSNAVSQVVLAFRSVLPTHGSGFYQSWYTTTASGTTCAATLPLSVVSGDLLTMTVTNRSGSVNPTSVSDGTNTWYLAATDTNQTIAVYYAMNVASGSTTVTATFAGSQEINCTVNEYGGVSTTYAVEIYTGTGLSSSPVSASITTFGSNDIVFSLINDKNSSQSTSITTYSPSSGYTPRAYVSNATSASELFDKSGSAATYTNSVTVTNGSSNIAQVMVAFRSVLPNPGRVQYTQFNTATSLAYPLPNTSGDTLLAILCYSGQGNVPPPTDTNSNTWTMLPVWLASDSRAWCYLAYARNVVGGANTVSLSSATGSGAGGGSLTKEAIQLFEYAGIANVTPLAGSSYWFLASATAPQTVDAGTVVMPSAGVLFSVATQQGNGTGTVFTSGSAVLNPLTSAGWTDAFDNAIATWDAPVSSGSYDNSVTFATVSNYDTVALVGLTAANLSTPVVRSVATTSGSGGHGSRSLTPGNSVVAGDLLFVPTVSDSTIGTVSDTCSNSYSLLSGGGSAQSAVWYAVSSCSGSLTVTVSSADSTGLVEVERISSPVLDQVNSGTSSGTSQSTGSITPLSAGELLVSVGQNEGATDTTRFPVSGSSGWSYLDFASASHESSNAFGFQYNVPITSYSNTFTWGSSQLLYGTIASFTFGASHPFMPPVVY